MLELLRIRDLALIEDIELELAPGMNVLTGETGAGKSFILKALNFLTGEKAGPDMVRPGKEKAVVEALFFVDEAELIVRRELSAENGRSRAYFNNQLCSLDQVREMRPRLLLHTSQHGQQKLLQSSFQTAILDDFLARNDLLEEKDRLARALSLCANRLSELEQARLALEDKREVLEYQQTEIEKVAPRPGEEEELEEKRNAARNQAGITDNVSLALSCLHGSQDSAGVLKLLGGLERATGALAAVLESFAETPGALAELRLSLQELDSRLRKAASRAGQETDIEAVEARLYSLAQLKRKLKRSLPSILSLQQEIKENLTFIDTCSLERAKLEKEEQELGDALAALLAKLNPARQAAAETLAAALQGELQSLGFSEHVRVLFDFSPYPLYARREDCTELRPRLFWQPNPGQQPQPLDRIASGGELSRFLLAVISLMSKNTPERPSLIFDEVDAGVGGLTLNRVADSLARLAASRQMLLITHWPQLASRADRHFVVEKEVRDGQTYTRCLRLTQNAIPAELARMAGSET